MNTYRRPLHGRRPRPTVAVRLRKAAVAPTGVHSVLDVMVFADVTHAIAHGAVGVLAMILAWYAARTLFAFAVSYLQD